MDCPRHQSAGTAPHRGVASAVPITKGGPTAMAATPIYAPPGAQRNDPAMSLRLPGIPVAGLPVSPHLPRPFLAAMVAF